MEVIQRSREEADLQDEEFGYVDFKQGEEKLGWMVTYAQVVVNDPATGAEVSGVDYYFIMQDGTKFKVSALVDSAPFRSL